MFWARTNLVMWKMKGKSRNKFDEFFFKTAMVTLKGKKHTYFLPPPKKESLLHLA
jgi:hypothetical protein